LLFIISQIPEQQCARKATSIPYVETGVTVCKCQVDSKTVSGRGSSEAEDERQLAAELEALQTED
jgi:hypothetical protein